MSFRTLRNGLLQAGALLVLFSCSQTNVQPMPSEFRIGATRVEILESFGPPLREQSIKKVGDAIWGPIEEFWAEVPAGGTVEIWAYRVQGGTLELYFINGSTKVQGTGFAREGVVFEGGS